MKSPPFMRGLSLIYKYNLTRDSMRDTALGIKVAQELVDDLHQQLQLELKGWLGGLHDVTSSLYLSLGEDYGQLKEHAFLSKLMKQDVISVTEELEAELMRVSEAVSENIPSWYIKHRPVYREITKGRADGTAVGTTCSVLDIFAEAAEVRIDIVMINNRQAMRWSVVGVDRTLFVVADFEEMGISAHRKTTH